MPNFENNSTDIQKAELLTRGDTVRIFAAITVL
ncbi:hypothetical protein T03_9602 [Trichinella britovi]|uniref:Uncharacterized protein n=1 Tax=Trichinella britovi TaxID=45882 RepID=A0A0V1APG3_TRIBR|nr:hypothetical protein T03_9602 [Trichinella britovi]